MKLKGATAEISRIQGQALDRIAKLQRQNEELKATNRKLRAELKQKRLILKRETELAKFADDYQRCRAAGYTGHRCKHHAVRDGLCGPHWSIHFGHEWAGMPALGTCKCTDCGTPRSEKTIYQRCPKKTEEKE